MLDDNSLIRELKAKRDFHERERDKYAKILAQLEGAEGPGVSPKRGRHLALTAQHVDWIKERHAQKQTYAQIARAFKKNFFSISYGTVRNIIKGDWRGELQH